MTVSPRTFADLRRDEGYRATVYDDATGLPIKKGSTVVGNPTIWYGLRCDVPTPMEAGELAMKLKAEGNWADLVSLFPWLKDQDEDVKSALQNMAYTMGAARLSTFELMFAALEHGDRITAALNCRRSKWHDEAPLRCERVANLMRGHIEEADD
jgi:GH24 family phage-related lysozyme (muramidase)